MVDANWTVVKVGGSLYDLPDLGARLRTWLARLGSWSRILLVPGGGVTADAIRHLDRTHQLGEEASHWLAIQVLSINARFLQTFLPMARLVATVADAEDSETCILDPFPFFQEDEGRHDHLPHVWQVTSDSLAVRVAKLTAARELILLKSTDWHGSDLGDTSIVDGYFAEALRGVPSLRIRVVNLRDFV